jgi:Cu+-exporting ATPase
MAYDPVCGMYVDEHTDLTSSKEGRKYYFCSATCRLQFEKPEREMRELKRALIIAWPVSIAILLLTYAFTGLPYEKYIMFALATLVQFYSGYRFYMGTIDAMKNRSSNMDTLIAIGTTAAWAYSSFVVFFPGMVPMQNLYFDTSALIISLILSGTYMQRLAEVRATSSIEAIIKLQPKTAHAVIGSKIIDVDVSELKRGAVLLVKPGERIPVDATVIHGSGEADESMITGESMPVPKKAGDKVMAGTINVSGAIKIKAQKTGEDTALSQIISIIRDAASSRVPVQRLVDKVSSYFVPIVILIAIASFILWLSVGNAPMPYAILAFVSVLIIACPCALGIATPAALMVSSGLSARNHILVKSGEALETASKVDTIIFDKTGTLTKGKPEVTEVIAVKGHSKREVIGKACIAEANSEHILGKAIIEYAHRIKVHYGFPVSFKYMEGRGIYAVSKSGERIIVGNRDMFKDVPIVAEKGIASAANEGKTPVIIGVNGKVIGIIAIADKIKDESKGAIKALSKEGIEIFMITGDNAKTAHAVAKKLGIENVIAEAKPQDKLKKIEELQKEGRTVAMVGDGINDAPALAKADVGIALGAGTDVAIEAGGIVLVRNNINDVAASIMISKATMGKIRQNLFWAFGYNTLLIPVAAGALVPFFGLSIYGVLPLLAAFAMSLSSVTVVLNSIALSGYSP